MGGGAMLIESCWGIPIRAIRHNSTSSCSVTPSSLPLLPPWPLPSFSLNWLNSLYPPLPPFFTPTIFSLLNDSRVKLVQGVCRKVRRVGVVEEVTEEGRREWSFSLSFFTFPPFPSNLPPPPYSLPVTFYLSLSFHGPSSLEPERTTTPSQLWRLLLWKMLTVWGQQCSHAWGVWVSWKLQTKHPPAPTLREKRKRGYHK